MPVAFKYTRFGYFGDNGVNSLRQNGVGFAAHASCRGVCLMPEAVYAWISTRLLRIMDGRGAGYRQYGRR